MKTNALAQILKRTTEIIRRKHMALATERAYCGWIQRYYDYCLGVPKDWTAQPSNVVPFESDAAGRSARAPMGRRAA